MGSTNTIITSNVVIYPGYGSRMINNSGFYGCYNAGLRGRYPGYNTAIAPSDIFYTRYNRGLWFGRFGGFGSYSFATILFVSVAGVGATRLFVLYHSALLSVG